MRTVLVVLGIWAGVAFALVGVWVLIVKMARRNNDRREAGYARDAVSAPSRRSAPGGELIRQASTPSDAGDERIDMPPAQAVVRAWTEPSQDPRKHAEAQLAVREAIPDLAYALDRLAAESQHRRTP
ncbi:hypothetical protein [Phytoactinopolyspora endophytica]|uniref:hypothetical protein n=1 Tax=Phytoactinopolyspora endophytica TaxID=1642495 RepID=UPI00101BF191|nr:hypothetical protein [Phytoactinopolyspora endophytica]